MQEEVTRSIVTAITPEIAAAELAKARRHRPADLSAYEIALRAWGDAWTVYRKADAAGLDGIFAQAEQALAIDPESTLALNCVAFASWQSVFFRSAASLFDARERGVESCATSDRDRSFGRLLGHVIKGGLLGHATYDDGCSIPYDEALDALETAHRLNPNDHFALRMLGLTKATAGYPGEAIEHSPHALRLNRRDPVLGQRFPDAGHRLLRWRDV